MNSTLEPTGTALPEQKIKPTLTWNALMIRWRNWKNRHVGAAMNTLTKALQADRDYAESWHANLSMAIYDESRPQCICELERTQVGVVIHHPKCPILKGQHGYYKTISSEQCNATASRIMKHCFDVEV